MLVLRRLPLARAAPRLLPAQRYLSTPPKPTPPGSAPLPPKPFSPPPPPPGTTPASHEVSGIAPSTTPSSLDSLDSELPTAGQVKAQAEDLARTASAEAQNVKDQTVDTVKEATSDLPSADQLKAQAQDVAETASASVQNVKDQTVDAVTEAKDQTVEAIKDATSELPSVDQLKSQAPDVADNAAAKAQELKDKTVEAKDQAVEAVKEATTPNPVVAEPLPPLAEGSKPVRAEGSMPRLAEGSDRSGTAGEKAKRAAKGVSSAIKSTLLLLGAGAVLYYTHDSRAGIYRWAIMPALHYLTGDDAEKAHELAIAVLASGLAPVDMGEDDPALAISLWGKEYSSPIGIAAGFDKHGEAIDGLFKLGFSYVEVGSVTPEPQAGNPQPRIFRVPSSRSIVNRYGFNSEGHAPVLERLRTRIARYITLHAPTLPSSLFPVPPAHALPSQYNVVEQLLESPEGQDAKVTDHLGLPRSLREGQVLGINLGKNKVSDPDSVEDFLLGVRRFGPLADTLVINVSSPNTPGLRGLQRKGMVDELLSAVVEERNKLPGGIKPPVLVKIAPDLDEEQVKDIADAVVAAGIDGVIVSNTTISRPVGTSGTEEHVLKEIGGLSGPPVKSLALKTLKALREATDGKVVLIGCGGISSGADVVEYGKAGATLVQAYTAMVYEGFGLPRKLKDEVAEILRKEGKTWKDIVGEHAAPIVRRKKEAAVSSAPVDSEAALNAERTGGSSKGKDAVPAKEEDFSTSLVEARKELEQLLLELSAAEKSPSSSVSSSPTSAAPADASNTPTLHQLPASDIDATLKPAAALSTGETIPSPLEIPANAVLDKDAIMSLLDPAAAQVKSGGVEKKEGDVAGAAKKEAKKEEVPLKDQKKWV